jgi:anti-anti-sigma regulatory factor
VMAPLTTEPGWTPWDSAVATFGRMTLAALDDGYTGLRMLTDASEVVRNEGSRPLWVRSEHLLERHRSDQPLAIACGYDADLVGDEVLAEVACLHGLTGGTPCSFLIHADGHGHLALCGDVDRVTAGELYHAVVSIAEDIAGPVVLDLSEQPFVDHSALAALDRAARTLGTTVHLVGASPLTACLVDALPLTGVTVLESR